MAFERRYIIMMVCSILFIGFFLTPMGEHFFREFGGMNNGKSLLEKMDYYSRREFSGAKKDLTYAEIFKDDDVYARTEFFYKPKTSDHVLRSGLVLKNDESDQLLSETYLRAILNIGYQEVINNKSNKEFITYEFKTGKMSDLYTRFEIDGESEELIIKDTYDTKAAYHLISGIDTERFRTALIDELPFLFDIQITRLPLSKDHIIVKTIVDKDLNFSKKKGLENRIKDFTQMDYISVVYTHRGQVVDRTIDENDPAVDRLYLNLDDVQSYYTRDQLDMILEK